MPNNSEVKKPRRIRSSSEISGKKSTEAKKPSDAVAKGNKHGILHAITRPLRWFGTHVVPKYIRNSFAELRNITWPTLKQSRQLTTAVVLFAIIFAIFVSSIDYGLDKVFKKVFLHE